MTTATITPKLMHVGSHWLELDRYERNGEPFSKEELYPILELEVPRVGFVRALFTASRYVASSWNEADGSSSPVWSDWRMYLSDVRAPLESDPDSIHQGRPAAGVGPATHKTIAAACEPIVRAWIASDEYRRSRRRAASFALRQNMDAPRSYQLEDTRKTLEAIRGELGPMEATHLETVLEALETAAAGLDREPLAD